MEPEPSKTPFYRESPSLSFSLTRSEDRKSSPIGGNVALPQILTSEDDENSLMMNGQNSYQGDCPTCQKNWDLLNRNQETRISLLVNGGSSKEATVSTVLTRPTDSSPVCLSFDMDGLLPSVDRQQLRLGQILATKEVYYLI